MIDVYKIAQELRDKLLEYDDFIGLYLYGSQIMGTATPESDIDIIAIFKNEKEYKQELAITKHLLDIELKNEVIIDFHPMTMEMLNLNYIFFNEVKKGLFYGAK